MDRSWSDHGPSIGMAWIHHESIMVLVNAGWKRWIKPDLRSIAGGNQWSMDTGRVSAPPLHAIDLYELLCALIGILQRCQASCAVPSRPLAFSRDWSQGCAVNGDASVPVGIGSVLARMSLRAAPHAVSTTRSQADHSPIMAGMLFLCFQSLKRITCMREACAADSGRMHQPTRRSPSRTMAEEG